MAGRSRASIALVSTLAVFGFAFAGLSTFAPEGLQNGDAVDYRERIERVELDDLTVHRGYFLLGIAFSRAWPGGGDRELNLLACACSAASLALAFAIGRRLTSSVLAAAFCAAATFAVPEFAANAAVAEVYSAQLALFLLGVFVLVRGRVANAEHPVGAGLAFGAAALVTPSSALAAPAIVLLAKRPRTWVVVGVVAALVVAASALPSLGDWLHGRRGLLLATESSMSFAEALAKERRELGSTWVLLPFAAAAVLRARRDANARALVFAAPASWVVTFFAGERFDDVPAQLPTWTLLAIVTGVGFAEAIERAGTRRIARVAVITLGAALLAWPCVESVRELEHQERRAEKYKDLCAEIGLRASADSIPIGLWSRCVLFEHYRGRDRAHRELLSQPSLDGTHGAVVRAEEWRRLDAALAAGRQLWLVSTPAPEVAAAIERAGYAVRPFASVFVAERAHR